MSIAKRTSFKDLDHCLIVKSIIQEFQRDELIFGTGSVLLDEFFDSPTTTLLHISDEGDDANNH
jgi:hypothetical protein|nr:hypothetical protein [bacterium]